MEFKSLEDRMVYYEKLYDYRLPYHGHVIVKVDGRSFSKRIRKKLDRPFDGGFISDMNSVAVYLCRNVMNARFAFVQSDEISIYLCDFENRTNSSFFDNRLSKLHSIIASMTTGEFNRLRILRNLSKSENGLITLEKPFEFDCRAFAVPSRNDVYGFFLWRQNDCIRNAMLMIANSCMSSREMHGKKFQELDDAVFLKTGGRFADYPAGQQRGRFITKVERDFFNENINIRYMRSAWIVQDAPLMREDEGKSFVLSIIPSVDK
jgi:tRNA(His) 5'-end guanylyltransferase